MAFTIKKGDLVYAADATLGFVSDVFRPQGGGDQEAGWAAVEVPELAGVVYITAADVASRDEGAPSVLLKIPYAQATDEAHRRQPEAVARGEAPAEETPLLEVGRPEQPGAGEATQQEATPSSEPARSPQPDAVRDWPAEQEPQPPYTPTI